MTSERDPLAAPRSPRLAVLGLAVGLATVPFIVAVDVVFVSKGQVGSVWFSAIPILLIVDMSVVGGVLPIRRPGNVIGSILLGAGVLTAASFASGYYLDLDGIVGPGRLPLVVPIAWIGSWTFVPAIVLMVAFLPLLFPTGHLPGPRWRLLAGLVIVAGALGTLKTATAPGPLQNADSILNPVLLPPPLMDWVTALGTLSNLAALPAFLLAVASVIFRFRAARGVVRQQLKWFLFVASIAAVSLGVSIGFDGPISDAAWIMGLLAMGCLPLAIGIAILRYRLYEIDRIVSRSVSYAAVTAVLVVVFASVNLVLQASLASVTQAGTLAVAASTLVVFALFQPLRRRVQAVVDRRFNRGRYEAEREVAGFAVHVRDQVDVDRVAAALEQTLERTMRPATAAIWLRSEGTR